MVGNGIGRGSFSLTIEAGFYCIDLSSSVPLTSYQGLKLTSNREGSRHMDRVETGNAISCPMHLASFLLDNTRSVARDVSLGCCRREQGETAGAGSELRCRAGVRYLVNQKPWHCNSCREFYLESRAHYSNGSTGTKEWRNSSKLMSSSTEASIVSLISSIGVCGALGTR